MSLGRSECRARGVDEASHSAMSGRLRRSMIYVIGDLGIGHRKCSSHLVPL